MSRRRTSIPDSPTEVDFLRHWRAAVADEMADEMADATSLAVAGGSVSDRLAWVFMSGYQAALRRCFPEFVGAGWSCFAAAEPEGGPGCTLEPAGDAFRLTGRKSWIAGARSIESLVVSVGTEAARRFVLVPRHAEGVSITVPREPAFLKELSQGAAEFDGVQVPERHVVADPARARLLRGAEPLYVLVALNACVRAAAMSAGNSRLSLLATNTLEIGRVIADSLGDWERFDPALDGLKAATTFVVDAVSKPRLKGLPDSLRKSWAADAKLFRMFGVQGLL